MSALFVYLVKVNIALIVFCLGYYAVLRPLTFYALNRVYLVCAILFATLYPLVDFSALLYRHQEIAQPVQLIIINWQAPVVHAVHVAQQHNKWFWLELIFWTGVIVLAIRFITQLLSLYKVHRQSKPVELHQYLVRVIQGDINPFSFWKSIYINPDNHDPHELKAILAHEQVHVNEWHTLDILLGELSTIFYWFNPGVWLMKKAIRENIEFITDQKILQSGSDPRAYQYSLLNVTFNGGHNAIVNHFNTSTIKKRIIMMNSKRSSPINLTRYAVLVPAVIVLVLVFTVSKAELGKRVAKGNAAIAKAFNNTINNIITPANISSATTATKRKLMILPNAVSTFFNESLSPTIIDTPRVGKIVSGTEGNVITVVGYGKPKNDTILVLNDERTQTLLKEIPGVSISPDGKITANGNEVHTVRINGKTYTPVANVRADSISKIQVIGQFNRASNNNLNGVVIRSAGGGASTMRLSGTTQAPKPLIIIDGKEITENINNLNPNDINSIDVLKGPSATNIYGEKATNGVILVTTKSPHTWRSEGGLTYSTYGPNPAYITNDPAVNKGGVTVKNNAIDNSIGNTIRANPGGNVVTTTEPRVINFSTKNIFSGKLLLLDGKETTESELNKISADKIKVIKQLTEKERAKYGDKAKNGGFSITTNK